MSWSELLKGGYVVPKLDSIINVEEEEEYDVDIDDEKTTEEE